ncbi:MAG: DNA polymerase I [Alphaproteobacteria bacterium]|nr:DNA polymerase I [Alphaproteobacteria bacterium]
MNQKTVSQALTSPANSSENELYLVDGSGFIFRAYYAMAYSGRGEMTNPQGVSVGAVYIFVNMLLKLLKDYDAPYMAVIFDAARANFRNEIYPAYKANRDETPEDLIPQFPLIREATAAFDIPAIQLEGYEADDLIAAYTLLAREQGKTVTIVSSDKDLMQLVGDGVRILDPMKNIFCGPAEVLEKFGVEPSRVVDVQALAGDSTDNVPGVPGIGIKTAAELINEYGSLEELLARAGEIKQPKRREKLIENADLARISKRLVSLDAQAPVPLALDALKTHDPDKPALMAFLREQGFSSIIRRLENGGHTAASSGAEHPPQQKQAAPALAAADHEISIKDNAYELINTREQLRGWIEDIYKNGTVCIDTETTSITPAKARLVGISLAATIGRAGYIPLTHRAAQADLLGETKGADIAQLPLEEVLEQLRPVLTDPAILKIGHNLKYDWQIFARHGIELTPCDDTMLISYVLDGSSHGHGMDFLALHHLGHETIKYQDVAGKGKSAVTFDLVDIEKAKDYAAEDADITLRLWHRLKPRLAAEKMASVYENIERPLIPVIARMEMTGICVSPQILKSMSGDFGMRIAALEAEIQKMAGTQFNVASPKQIGEILFDQMGLPGGTKTKTGQWATDVDVLEELAAKGHEIVEKILEWRGLSKLKSTYTDALQAEINPETGRVHTSFHMSGTSTGRLSSSDPNLQNIPIRSEDGRKIRKAFVAREGYTLLSADYSQVELRLVAEMADVAALKQAFRDKTDIHTLTASQVFGLPVEEVTPEIRRRAKAVNFGIIYGISGWGLARQLGCPPAEAGDFIKRYLNRFPEIRDYMEAKKEEAKAHGFVKTLYGRKCYTPYINAKIPAQRAGAERAAINAPLQGTAADIMKISMIKIPVALAQAGLSAKMVLQVHDELIFEVPEAELAATADLVKETLENAFHIMGIKISVPLETETGSGPSWAEAH